MTSDKPSSQLTSSNSNRIVKAVQGWAKKNLRDFPWRHSSTPFKVMVAEILLRRTTSSAVRRVYEDFVKAYPTLEALARANPSSVEARLRTLGYQKQRARIMTGVAKDLLEQYGGIPLTLGELEAVDDIGPYTAGAILSLACHEPAPMVDSNVLRVFHRVTGQKLNAETVSQGIVGLLTPENVRVTNLGLIDFGAVVCRYKNPRCQKCSLRLKCDFNRVMASPQKTVPVRDLS